MKQMIIGKWLFFIGILVYGGHAFCSYNKAERQRLLQAGQIDAVIQTLSFEEKIGQLFFGFFYSRRSDSDLESFIEKSKLGNIIYYRWANDFDHPEQVRKLSCQITETLKGVLGIAPLIAVDQEGGSVVRLKGEYTQFPTLGGYDANLIEKAAFAMGCEMRVSGVHMDFAPVVDVGHDETSPLYPRTLGGDLPTIESCARHFIAGLHRAHIAATLKHFVGLGTSRVDSHTGRPEVMYDSQTLAKSVDFNVFAALAKETDAIMTAHVLLPEIDPEHIVSESPSLIQGWLRAQLSFKGVIISDSLAMRGVLGDVQGLDAAIDRVADKALAAFCAGNDMLILGRLEWSELDVDPADLPLRLAAAIHSRFRQAWREGTVDTERIDASLRRILQLKYKYCLAPPPPLASVPWQEHRRLADQLQSAN